MSNPVNEALQGFTADDRAAKLLAVVHERVPGAQRLWWYSSVNDAVRVMRPGATRAQFAAAKAMCEDTDVTDILRIARLMDAGDKGYAILTGVRSTLGFFFGDRDKALEFDEEQRNDAVLKALAIAAMTHNAFPGGVPHKVRSFADSPACQSIALYYGAVEVALPFADNLAMGGGELLDKLVGERAEGQLRRLGSMVGGKLGGDRLSGDNALLNGMLGKLGGVVDAAAGQTGAIAKGMKKHLPKVASGADKVTGVVAAAADVLPVYRLLGARLAAEAAVVRAIPE